MQLQLFEIDNLLNLLNVLNLWNLTIVLRKAREQRKEIPNLKPLNQQSDLNPSNLLKKVNPPFKQWVNF